MTLKPDTGCCECDLLLSRYEATTFSLVKLQNSLTKAEAFHDAETIGRLTVEAKEAAFRQRKAHDRYSDHRTKVHGDERTPGYDSDLDVLVDTASHHA